MKKYANGISNISEMFDHRNMLFHRPRHSKGQYMIMNTNTGRYTVTMEDSGKNSST